MQQNGYGLANRIADKLWLRAVVGLPGKDKRPLRHIFDLEQRRRSMRIMASVLAFAVGLMIVGKLSADDKVCPTTETGHHAMMSGVCLKGLNLTDDQKAKVDVLKKEYRSKFRAAADTILTADQRKARDDAVKAAKAAGKKGPEVWKAAREAVKPTDDQKAKFKEVMRPLRKELHAKVLAILTSEQKEQLKQNRAAVMSQHHAMGMQFLKGLNLTDEQKAKVKALHKESHEKLMAILTPEQKEQLKKHDACK
jgi:Spy/CpxP family protein refolding chaperone